MNREPFFIRRSMSAFRVAVLERKHVTVGFIGGSITDPRGRERWSEYVINWLVGAYPEVTVDVENVAIGATGSDYAVFRVERDLICRNCDLIFIEYAVNDNAILPSIRNASREGLIRKLLRGTQADLVLTYTYCAPMLPQMLAGEMPDSVAELERLAEHYALNSVFMAQYALHEALRGVLRWEEWLPDGLHPENTGSRYYAEPVCALLQQALKTEGDTLRRQIVQPVFSDNWEHAEAFPLQNVRRIGYWRLYRCLDRPLVQQVLSTTSIGSRIQCSFLGNGLVLTVSFGWMAADYRWRVDGSAWTTERYDRPAWMDDHSWLRTKTLLHGLKMGKHTVEFEVLPPLDDGAHKGTTFEICCIGILKDE